MSAPTFAANKKMQITASYIGGGTSIDVSGRVSEPNNASVSNAVISIQVTNPQGTSIGVGVVYSDNKGGFGISFPLSTNYAAGNYTAYLVADKPGYDTARLTLAFTIATPDFSIEVSASSLTLEQGATGYVTVTVLSLRDFKDHVNVTAIDQPSGIAISANPQSITPSGTTTITISTSFTAPAGNYTVTILGVSGSLSHKTTFLLTVKQGPIQANLSLMSVGTGAAILLLAALGLALRSRGRKKQREAVLEDLLKQASTDTGYVATARVIARLEELRAMGKVDEPTYQELKKEYEKRLESAR
jgi:hypothetical protein